MGGEGAQLRAETYGPPGLGRSTTEPGDRWVAMGRFAGGDYLVVYSEFEDMGVRIKEDGAVGDG